MQEQLDAYLQIYALFDQDRNDFISTEELAELCQIYFKEMP